MTNKEDERAKEQVVDYYLQIVEDVTLYCKEPVIEFSGEKVDLATLTPEERTKIYDYFGLTEEERKR